MTDEYESQYFGKSITDEEVEHLRSLTDKHESRDYLAAIQARALKQFPGTTHRMTGSGQELLIALGVDSDENKEERQKKQADLDKFMNDIDPDETPEQRLEDLKRLLAYKPKSSE